MCIDMKIQRYNKEGTMWTLLSLIWLGTAAHAKVTSRLRTEPPSKNGSIALTNGPHTVGYRLQSKLLKVNLLEKLYSHLGAHTHTHSFMLTDPLSRMALIYSVLLPSPDRNRLKREMV